jgi:sirohydrochlorin ferrochelatase
MNRTARHTCSGLLALLCTAGFAAGQETPAPPQQPAQDPAIEQLVAHLRAQEQAAKSVRMELTTEGTLPGNLEFTTKGTLRVLRAAQGGVTAVHSRIDFTFSDGLQGDMESVKTPDGVLMLEHNPTFGEVFVRMDAGLVADLEWAGQVLQRSNVPGLADARAAAPLGSSMVEDLARRYQLAELSRKDQNGQPGVWYGGDRRAGPGLQGEDPDVPLADRVELFVREGDRAVLQVVYLRLGKVVQRIRVGALVVDEAMPLESFKLDAKGLRPRDVREHAPMWEQIEQMLRQAQQKAGDELPPSKRK